MNRNIKKIEINSIPQFIDEIEKIYTDRIWFRGHSKLSYSLSPSIYRTPYKPEYEEFLISQFKSRAIPYLNKTPAGDYWEWLFLMQHHGIPTRLLDWSNSALVGLAFAILFKKDSDENAAVWCLNPMKLNTATKVTLDKFNAIPNITTNKNAQSAYKFDSSFKSEYPIAITGPLNNDRIIAQKGTFTLFPNSTEFNLEDKEKADEFLTLLIIKKENISEMKNQLAYLGISESSLYPDLNNLALEIKRDVEILIKKEP